MYLKSRGRKGWAGVGRVGLGGGLGGGLGLGGLGLGGHAGAQPYYVISK